MFRHSISSALLFAALSTTGLVTLAHAKDTSGWTTTKVADGAAGAYCAVSRTIDDVTLTVGRSLGGASSLALEFKNGKLDPQKTYRISLKPGSAERIEVDAQPISPTVFVLNLDQVVDLQKSFAGSPTLQLRYDDQSRALGLSNWDAADKDLGSCLAALKPEPAKVAKTEPKTEQKAEPKSEPVKMAAKTDDMGKAAAKLAPVEDGRIAELQQENNALSDENKRLAETMRMLRTDLENAQQKSSGAPVVELQEKIKWLEAQNAELRRAPKPVDITPAADTKVVESLRAERDQLKADLADAKKKTEASTTTKTNATDNSFVDLKARVAALESENKTLKDDAAKWIKDKALLETQLSSARATASTASNDQIAQAGILKTQLDQARKENVDLKAKAEELAKAPVKPAVDPAMQAKIDSLMAQIDQLSGENADLKAQINVKTDKPETPDMAALQQRNETLAAENVRLRAQVAAASTPVDDMKVSVAAELPLRQQLRSLRSDNDMLRARNAELMDQLDGKLRGNERELLTTAKKNWDLEQATRRYQEAEREIKRLSLTLREDRAKCTAEKKEIEYMLFDPKLAKEGQIALLNSLEDQLAAARAGQGNAAVHAAPAPVTMASVQPKPSTSILDDLPLVPSRPNDGVGVMAEKLPDVVAPVPPAAVPVTTAATPATGPSLASLLQQAGVQISRAIAPAAKNPFGPGKAWTWETGELAGLSVEQAAVKPGAFDATVSQQLGKLKSFCKGDFAAQPAGNMTTAGVTYATYDAACIAGANSTSAAILFYQKGGAFNVISHEAAPDAMDKAMDVRDRIVNSLGG